MSALTAARNTPVLGAGGVPVITNYPVAASTTIYPGGIVAINSSGYLVMASDTSGLTVVGMVDPTYGEVVVNSGSNGAVTAPVMQGCFRWGNGNSITLASVGATAYVSDDQTVATSGTSNSIIAGIIYMVDTQGVWVYSALGAAPGSASNLNTFETNLATYNTSAVGANLVGVQDADSNFGTAPTVEQALKQLAEQPKLVISCPIPAYSAIANSGVLLNLKPGFAGRIISMHVQATTAVTTSAKAATLTPEIAGTPVTGGVVSMTSAGQNAIGAVQDGTAVTGLNTFTATQSLTVVASSVTSFSEGAGVIYLVLG